MFPKNLKTWNSTEACKYCHHLKKEKHEKLERFFFSFLLFTNAAFQLSVLQVPSSEREPFENMLMKSRKYRAWTSRMKCEEKNSIVISEKRRIHRASAWNSHCNQRGGPLPRLLISKAHPNGTLIAIFERLQKKKVNSTGILQFCSLQLEKRPTNLHCRLQQSNKRGWKNETKMNLIQCCENFTSKGKELVRISILW